MMTDTATELKHTKTNGPHWEKFEAISLNPTATMCAASGRRPDGQRPQISIYDPIKGKHLHSIDGLSGDVLALCFISEQILCVGQSSGDLGLWQIDEQRVQVLTTIKLSHSAVTTLAYDNLGQSLYVGCEDGLLRAISFGDWSEREVNFEWPNDVAIRALAVDINGDWIAAAGDDGVIRVYSTSKGGEPYRVMPGHEGAVRALVLHPREYRLISSGDDRSIRMWYLQGEIEFQDRAAKQEHSKAITCMVLGPVFLDDNGDEIPPRLLTGSEDGTVKIWPLATQRQPKTIEIGKSAVTSIAMTKQRDGAILVAANSSRVIAGYTFNKQTEPVGEHLTLFSEFHDLRYRLRSKKLKERVESLEKLASKIEDPGVFEAILGAMREDQEPDVRAAAVLYLAQTKYRRPIKELREALNDGHAKVRSAALDGLRQLQGADALAPLASALQSNYEDTRCLSIKELVALRERTPNVVRLVRQALQDRAKSVQIAALDALEQIYPSTAQHPDNTALLLALRENNPELQLEVLYRIHRYQWARLPEFQAHLTQLMDHEYVNIRQTTFQLLIASIPQLVEAVRPLDEVLDRQLAELDEVIVGTRSATSKDTAKKAAGADKSRKKAPRSADQANLDDWCKQPLYLGQSSRHADIVLRATSLLAKLQDLRAFGTLLQLSQSTEADTRRDTAFALRDLADPRAMICLTQLMNDASKEVRDIAFDSFDVLATEPLQLARTALSCIHPDLRHRALQKLMGEQKKSPSTDAIELLTYALGDSDASVRNEAFKILWNLLADEPQRCLLLALSSQNPDMRKKAIDEMSAAFGVQSWAQDAILGALHDPNTEVHNRAYDVLEKILPKSELTLIRRALQTDHKSLRIKALQQLSKAKKADQRPLLLEILAENERELRQLALDILIDKFAKDQDTLADALKISHWDVRLKVAQHLAALGNARVLEVAADYLREETQRLDEFVRYYQCPPHQNILDVLPDKEKAQLREYRKAIISIVEQLGVADGINYIQPFVDDPDSEVAIQAVRAISLCADITHGELVSRFLDFRLKQVRAYAIEGLARLGQSSVLNEVQALLSGSNREEQRRAVIALHALAEVGRPHTRQLLNHGQLYVRHDAWSILLAHEYQMASRGEMPSDLLYAISSKYAEIRLEAAHILQHRTKREAFLQTILDVFCGFYNFEATPKGQNLRNELVQHLPAWFESLNSEQAPQRHAAASLLFVRHDVEEFLATLKRRLKQWSKTKAEPISAVDQVLEHSSEYQELAFGTYIGLLRQANSTDIQIKALQGIVSLDRTYFPTLMLQSVFEQAILHPDSSEVRKAALQLFHALDPADHAHTYIMAIASPHPDIGLAALQMIAAEASEVARLWTTRALQSAVREVRHKAAEQLQNLYPDHSLEPFILILQSEYTDVRLRVIDRLLRTEDARVTEALTQALSSDHWELRLKAAEVLAERKVVSAYEVLVEFLNSEDHAMQKRAALSLVVLGDPRAVAALTARFDDDPEQTANKSLLLQSLGELALDLAADWLVQKLDYPDIQITQQAFGALLGLAVSDGKPDIERLVRYLERALRSANSPPRRRCYSFSHPQIRSRLFAIKGSVRASRSVYSPRIRYSSRQAGL
jgi:ParB family chromosome partitioning protein